MPCRTSKLLGFRTLWRYSYVTKHAVANLREPDCHPPRSYCISAYPKAIHSSKRREAEVRLSPLFEGPPISFLEPEQNAASFCLTKYRCGPATLPFLGNAVKFLQPRHLLFEWFVQCQRCFGFETFAISIPSLPAGVVISDPENLEYVLKNESAITKGEFFRRRSWDLFGVSYS